MVLTVNNLERESSFEINGWYFIIHGRPSHCQTGHYAHTSIYPFFCNALVLTPVCLIGLNWKWLPHSLSASQIILYKCQRSAFKDVIETLTVRRMYACSSSCWAISVHCKRTLKAFALSVTDHVPMQAAINTWIVISCPVKPSSRSGTKQPPQLALHTQHTLLHNSVMLKKKNWINSIV